jgi:hypothetical protein
MYYYPFKHSEVAQRFADGLLKAGLPGKSSGYYKICEENKLTGEEIRELVFGRRSTGNTPWAGQPWWVERTNDGKATHGQYPFHKDDLPDDDVVPWSPGRGDWRSFAFSYDSGRSWIEGDLLCSQWETVHKGLKYCGTVFRNPEGTPEMKDEYVKITDFGIIPFSMVD